MADRPASATLYRRRAVRLALAALASVAFLGAPAVVPPPTLAAECVGDECEAPPPAPEDPTPGTAVVEGPANPPPSWPAESGRGDAGHGAKGGHRAKAGHQKPKAGHHGKGSGNHAKGGHGNKRSGGGGRG